MNQRVILFLFILVLFTFGLFTFEIKAQNDGISQPIISLDKTCLYFGAASPNFITSSQTFLITNIGDRTLFWNVSDNAAWINCTPVSGINSGEITVSVNPTGLFVGTYTGAIMVSDFAAGNSPQIISVTLTVKPIGETSIPFGDFYTPLDGSIVQSSVAVTGWALDDLQVASVKIYRELIDQLIYIGDAVFIEGARPDIEQAFPGYPFNYKAGWGYMLLTNLLPNRGNGLFYLRAIAADLEGNEVLLGRKAISCDNDDAVRPFGAIDTPPQGGTVYGNRYINAGWVLTPPPNIIPINGSTIYVYVDGVKIGHPIYNLYRPDVAGLFFGYPNSGGAGAVFILDTTLFANGVHTIYWTASDSARNYDGIGSRYFTIQNVEALYPMQQLNPPPLYLKYLEDIEQLEFSLPGIRGQESESIKIKKGFEADAGRQDAGSQIVYPDKNGIFHANMRELDRIEIYLDPDMNDKSSSFGLYLGYLLMGEHLHSLPIGSTLDREKGIFYWQPGAGFLGDYTLMFMRSDCNSNNRWKKINIEILPKWGVPLWTPVIF